MTKGDKIFFLGFIFRTAMYIGSEEENSIISYVRGYENGRRSKCDFTILLSKHFEDKLSIKLDPRGWTGQIQEYADKRKSKWITVFKQEGLDIIAKIEP